MSKIDENRPKPFSIEYVLRRTVKYIRRSIDFSIDKTMNRIGEFKDDPVKSDEVFRTLALLQGLKSIIGDFESRNPQYFQE